MFTLLCYEDVFDCLEDCVQEQCCKGEKFQTVTLEVALWFCILFWSVEVFVYVVTITLEVVLWFCILFWLVDVSVVDD